MTSERKKSILILSMTLVAGILLGLLIPGLFHKLGNRPKYGNRDRGPEPKNKHEWFAGTLNRIIQPDSAQSKKIKPILQWAASEIDSAESTANKQMSTILDSVKIQIRPILTEEQLMRFNNFDANAKKTWNRREGQRRD